MSDERLYYFAFGSNLSSLRLRQRIPEASRHGVATLPAYRLCWHKNDQGQSGKCDIVAADHSAAQVYGVVYRLSPVDSLELDRYECTAFGYRRIQVRVAMAQRQTIDAFTYQAIDIDQTTRPFHWYKEHVLRGALEHRFPDEYLALIRNTESIDDPDRERHNRELDIYRDLPPLK